MDYKKQVIELLEILEDNSVMKFLYDFLNTVMKNLGYI